MAEQLFAGRIIVDEGRCHAHQSSSVDNNYSSLIILAFHYLSTPIQNEELLRKLYIEMDLSSYQIAEVSGWSRTSISDALRILDLSKETKKAPNLKYGEKLVGGKRVPHKEEQKVIKKIITLRNKGLSFRAIANYLNEKKVPSKLGGKWNKTTVGDIINRNQNQEA